MYNDPNEVLAASAVQYLGKKALSTHRSRDFLMVSSAVSVPAGGLVNDDDDDDVDDAAAAEQYIRCLQWTHKKVHRGSGREPDTSM